MSRRIFVLLLFLTCLPYPSCSLSPCVSVSVDEEVTKWKCPNFADRSGANKGTIEHKLSVACSWAWNVMTSLVLGAIDLIFVAFIYGWKLSVLIVKFFWGVLLIALDWLWNTALKVYADWAIHSIGPLWEWWYAGAWKLVVSAWDKFFLWGVLAFLAYCLWALLGLPVCVLASIALLVSIAIVFLLVCAAIALTFVVLVAIMLVSSLLAVVCALLLTAVSVLGLLVTIVLVGGTLLIGFIIIILGSLLVFFCGWVMIQGCIGMASVTLLAGTAKFAELPGFGSKKLSNDGKLIIWRCEVNYCVYHSYKSMKNVAVFSVQFFIALCFFLCDLSIVNDSTDAFMTEGHVQGYKFDEGIFETLTDKSEWLGKLPGYDVITSLGIAFSFTLSTISTKTIDYFDWKCPGPYFLLHSSQVAIGVVVLVVLQELQFKAAVTTMKSKSVDMQVLSLIAELTTSILLKSIELMFASATPAFYLIAKPKDTGADCSWEGDMTITVLSYVGGCITIAVSVFFLPWAALHVEPQNIKSWLPTITGWWSEDMLEQMFDSDNVVWQDYRHLTKERNKAHVHFSAEVAAASIQMFPLGAIVTKMMSASNKGLLMKPGSFGNHCCCCAGGESETGTKPATGDDLPEADPKPDKFAFPIVGDDFGRAITEKIFSLIRSSLLVLIPWNKSSAAGAPLLVFGVAAVFSEEICKFLCPRPEFLVIDAVTKKEKEVGTAKIFSDAWEHGQEYFEAAKKKMGGCKCCEYFCNCLCCCCICIYRCKGKSTTTSSKVYPDPDPDTTKKVSPPSSSPPHMSIVPTT